VPLCNRALVATRGASRSGVLVVMRGARARSRSSLAVKDRLRRPLRGGLRPSLTASLSRSAGGALHGAGSARPAACAGTTTFGWARWYLARRICVLETT